MKRTPRFFAMILSATVATAALATDAIAAGGGGEGGGSKTAFGPGEHVLQLPPMWVPVNTHRKGKTRYAPLSIFLTSHDGGITNMCYQLPYLAQAFLFELNTMDIRMSGRREIETHNMDGKLLAAAIKTTDRHTVKKIEVVSGTPHPTGSNQDMLALCQ